MLTLRHVTLCYVRVENTHKALTHGNHGTVQKQVISKTYSCYNSVQHSSSI